MNDYDVVVIGAGCAGMMAAGTAASMGKRVLLIEKNKILGKKLLITGKGRCNITNNCDVNTLIEHVPVNPRFLYSAFSSFTPQDAMALFEGVGVCLKTERGNRVFPQSDRSSDIVSGLKTYMDLYGVTVKTGTVKEILQEEQVVTGVLLEDDTIIHAMSVLVATGGKSYQLTGSTGDGYTFAEQMGHTIVPPTPSLVPLNTKQQFCRDLQGLSLRNVGVSVFDEEDTKIYSDFGEMLFTHFGVTGPLILSSSSHMRDFVEHKYYLLIDLKPALDFEALDRRVVRDFTEFNRKEFANALDLLLPKKMIPIMLKLSGIAKDKKISEITKEERHKVVTLLKNLRVDVASPRSIEEAIVTSGGVATTEINPKTMESKKVMGLYFAGEVIDVDAYTGGFNLQIAMSTGYLAGMNI